MAKRAHPECRNASNPCHECTDYCIDRIAEASILKAKDAPPEAETREPVEAAVAEDDHQVEPEPEQEVDESDLTEAQKKLRLLQRKLGDARKANQAAVIAEKKRQDAPKEERGVSKQKWFDEKQKTAEKRLEFSGLDKSKSYMLETQEAAEVKYEKQAKRPAAFGWDVFNQRSLYRAYKKRTKDIPYTVEDYSKAKDADPDFYRDATSLQYGKTPDIPQENVDKMVSELQNRKEKRKEFSRRRKYHEEKDIDAINDRNEHFNRKIERAFGKYTVEIKNNLERGTALPD